MNRLRAVIGRLESFGRYAEDAFLVLILTAMIVLAAAQILLRNAFDFGFIWTDELLRLMVLWIAVGGAVAASRSDRHISIAVLDRYLRGAWLAGVRVLSHGFTAAVCGALTVFSVRFVLTSREFEDVLLGGVPAWWLQAALPIGFGLMTWRYSLAALGGAWRVFRGGVKSDRRGGRDSS